MKRLLFLFASLALFVSAKAQDSLYYSVFWTPTYAYQKAGVKQEGIFLHHYKNGVVQDSILLHAFVYDSLGRVVRSEDYQRNKLLRRYRYFYSGKQLDSMEQNELWLREKVVHRYTYDESGNLTVKQTFNDGKRTIQERFVYNKGNQLLQAYQQIGSAPETLAHEYRYRNDRLLRQIDYWFEGAGAAYNFFYLYTYSNGPRSSKRFFQRKTEQKRYIDCIRTYNEKNQLIEKISPPLHKLAWLPPGMHARKEEVVETFFYHSNGMLAEVQTTINDQLVSITKHVYFY